MALPPERRALLQAAKLRAVVEVHLGADAAHGSVISATAFPGGAVLTRDGELWLLADDLGAQALGPALAWADGHEVARPGINLVAEDHAPTLARRASTFREPPAVWKVRGIGLEPARPSPGVTAVADPLDAAIEPWVADLEAAGVDVVVEHGQVIGEVAGLEVARVVVDPDGSARLEVGVGRHDREASAIMRADEDPRRTLVSVVDTVRARRRPGADPHPLNRLGAQRWLRSQLVADPGRVGMAELAPVAGLEPRPGVKDTSAVAAVGRDRQGRSVVVVTSVGIDLDLVPAAADLRLAHAPTAQLVLVVPERDAHPITRRMAATLVDPAEVVTVADDWR